tara:strand:+ start:742 stop:1089 length:348 start_codon:yes stop_codon:yes gene_type:complete
MISDHVWELLAPATVAYEDVGREEVEQGLSEGTFTLFESPKSAAVTCAFGDSLRIGLAGGNLQELKQIEEEICAFAKARNYRFVEIIGRPGWERELTDYKRTAVLLRKELGHGLH